MKSDRFFVPEITGFLSLQAKKPGFCCEYVGANGHSPLPWNQKRNPVSEFRGSDSLRDASRSRFFCVGS